MNFSKLPVISDVAFLDMQNRTRPMIAIPGRNFASLSLRISGKVTIASGGRIFHSGPGSLTFIPQGCPYRTETVEGSRFFVMHFQVENDCGGTACVIQAPYPQVFFNMFENAVRRYGSRGCDMALMSMAYQILSESHQVFSPGERAPRWLSECKKFIDLSITDPALRIRDLAEQCGVSEVYFRKEFARCYGCSPLEFIKQRRIETAKILLQTGLYTVTDVAFRSGFESSSYFSAEFRRATGMSPREYMLSGSI